MASQAEQRDVHSLGLLLLRMLGGQAQGDLGENALWRKVAQTGSGLSSSRLFAVCKLLSLMLQAEANQRPRLSEVAARLQQLSSVETVPGIDEDVETVRFSRLQQLSAADLGVGLVPTAPENDVSEEDRKDPLVGTLIGKYRIRRRLGTGGMGSVYLAKHEQIECLAAVKILHPELARDPDYAKRFLNEARAVNIVRHPGLVHIFEYGQLANGVLFLLMDFVEGVTLEHRLDRDKKVLSEEDARWLTLQIARALAIAHERNIVHRDLKPSNLMLVPDPVTPGRELVHVLDFGIAKVSDAIRNRTTDPEEKQQVLGTPQYMAPEQFAEVGTVDGKADVFALGALLFEALTGKVLFPSGSFQVMFRRPDPVRKHKAEISADFSSLLERMLDKDPDRRPSMQAICEVLERERSQGLLLPVARERRARLLGLGAGILASALLLLIVLGRRYLVEESLPSLEDLAHMRGQALSVLITESKNGDAAVRAQVGHAFGQARDPSQLPIIQALLSDTDTSVRVSAAVALGELGALEAKPALTDLLKQPISAELRIATARALWQLGVPHGRQVLFEMLPSAPQLVRLQAALSLLERGDEAGKSIVAAIANSNDGSVENRVPLLSALVRFGDTSAQEKLQRLLTQSAAPQAKLSAAATLAALGDHKALGILVDSAGAPGPERLLAALLLTNLGEVRFLDLFHKTATDSRQPQELRLLAIQGLSASGLYKGAELLLPLLASPQLALVRVTAAEAILRLVGSDARQAAAQTLRVAQGLLGSPDQRLRAAAVAALGEIESPATLPLLATAIRDAATTVRLAAARSLGRKHAREALRALRFALDDGDSEVRSTSLRSLTKVVTELRNEGDTSAILEVQQRLQAMTEGSSPTDQLIARAILARTGDRAQYQRLQQEWATAPPAMRALVIELLSASEPLVRGALTDSVLSVRLAAARKLTEAGLRDAVPFLQELLSKGGAERITAFALLRRLGESPAPPDNLAALLRQPGDSQLRLAVLDSIAELDAQVALPLLRLIREDSPTPEKLRALDVAAAHFRKNHQPVWIEFMRRMQQDSELVVRAHTDALLVQHGEQSLPSPAQTTPSSEGPHSPGAVPETRLLPVRTAVADAEGTRAGMVDMRAASEVSPSSASHPTPVDSPAKESTSPAVTAAVLLGDVPSLLERGQFRRAQQLLDKAHLQRSRLQPSQQADLLFLQARCYELQGLSQQAESTYQEFSRVPNVHRRSSHVLQADKSLQLMRSTMGTLRIYEHIAGRCNVTERSLRPGEYSFPIEGKPQSVRIRKGATTSIGICR